MEIKNLNTFLVLAELKNFTRTADRLNYAQSSVSAQIQQIEEELGVRLFERMGKRLLLTKEGEELEVYARKILQLSEEAKHKIGNHNTGCIKIGASESLAMTRLSKIIEQFHKKFPDIELHLRVLYTEDVAVLLQENEIDLALVLHTPFQHPSLSVLWEENEIIGVWGNGKEEFKKRTLQANDFQELPMILTGRGCVYRNFFEQDLQREGITPKIVLETSSIQVIKEMAVSGLGICLLPERAVEREVKAGKLERFDYTIDAKIVSQLLCHKDKWITNAMQKFIDMVINS